MLCNKSGQMEVPIGRKLKAPQTGFQPPVQLTLDQRATWLMSGPWESSKGTGPRSTDTGLWKAPMPTEPAMGRSGKKGTRSSQMEEAVP